MAETTNHPQVPPDAIMPEEALGTQTTAPASKYQALSLMAMASFGLSLVYALVVLIGGAVSLFGHIPWLMPYWTFLLPVAVLIVCWAARRRILNSEGTLTGLAFTIWGTRLAILFSITYAAYYFATFLAVRSPAIDCANEFFQRIKTGRLEEAFLMSQDVPTKGVSSSVLHDTIQSRFNQPMGQVSVAPGTFSRFSQERFVRFLEMDGEQARAEPTGVSSWEYTKGGYHVVLNYHIATSLMEFDMKVDTFGRDPKPGEGKGRQWLVLFARGETAIIPDSMRETPRGREFELRTMKAQTFAREWATKANDVEALTPAERESFTKLIRGFDKFWAGREQRNDIIRRIRNSFQPGTSKRPAFNLTLQTGGIPLLRESEGRSTVWIDVNMRYIEEGGVVPQYVVEGKLIVSADNKEAANSASAWRVDALEVDSGRTAPEMRRMQRAMPVPNAEEAGLGKGGILPDKPPAPPPDLRSPRPPR